MMMLYWRLTISIYFFFLEITAQHPLHKSHSSIWPVSQTTHHIFTPCTRKQSSSLMFYILSSKCNVTESQIHRKKTKRTTQKLFLVSLLSSFIYNFFFSFLSFASLHFFFFSQRTKKPKKRKKKKREKFFFFSLKIFRIICLGFGSRTFLLSLTN